MPGKIEARLKEIGISLPTAVAPAGNYVPAVRTCNLLFHRRAGAVDRDAADS